MTGLQVGRNAVRVGNTVRRPCRPGCHAVHALLRHLRNAGANVPEVFGIDDLGREVLSWVEGDSGQDTSGRLRRQVQTDEVLVQMGRLIRKIHDATVGFDRRSFGWNALLQDPSGNDEIVCHNDLSFWNTIFLGNVPVSLIDWEFAAPGSRLWDLAYAAWWLVPLHRPEAARALGWRRLDQCRRLRLFIDAYGLNESHRGRLFDVLGERQRANQRQLRVWVADGAIPPFDENDAGIECGKTDYVDSKRSEFESCLIAAG